MLTRIRERFAAPIFEDEDKTRAASLLNAALLTLLVATVVGTLIMFWIEPTEIVADAVFGIVLVVLILGLKRLMHRGRVQLVSGLLTFLLWGGTTFLICYTEGIRDPSFTAYFLDVAIAGLLMGRRAAAVYGIASILSALALYYGEVNGLVVFRFRPSVGPVDAFTLTTVLGLTTLLLRSAVRSINEGFSRARGYAAELEKEREHLEQTVEARTADLARRARYLEATAGVARDAASVLDLQELLSRTVALISERFGFYHTGIFLLDEADEYAVLRAASSEGGQRMLARGHRLQVSQEGIVGYVTDQGQPRIALDVGEDAVFFDNPDLPATRSEMALPLQARGEIIGALDVQSTQQAAFTDEDVAVLQTLADQVALAISNTRLFQQVQESLEAERRAYGEVIRAAWARLIRSRPDMGFVCNPQGIHPVGPLWQPEMAQAVERGQTIQDHGPTAVVPLKIRDRVVGAIRLRKADDADEWTEEEVAVVQMLTEQLSVALESARLYQDAQRRAARERLIGEVTDRMRETLDIETILRTGAQEVRQAMDLPEVVIRLATQPGVEPGNDDQNQDVGAASLPSTLKGTAS